MIDHRGNVFVVSAPSGAGKSTLTQRLLNTLPDLVFSVSYTTRAPRPGEVDGKDYFFISETQFDEMVREGGFVEWVEVYGHRYGTGRAWLDGMLATGKDVLLDIETKGAQALREAIPDACMIFILPPSAASLEARLRSRGKDSDEQIRIRLDYARHEMERYPDYDYLVMNGDLDAGYRSFESIILAARATRARMTPAARAVLEGF